jgi:hypothetical protein
MPGFLLHAGSIARCPHGGTALPASSNPRITVSGHPLVVQNSTFVIAGCALPEIGSQIHRCVTAHFVTAASRVRANGIPVLLRDSHAVCSPNGAPLQIVQTQTRVRAV